MERGRNRGGVEPACLFPAAGAGPGDAIAALGHGLIADGDLLVPALDKAGALETRHHLVEGRGSPPDTVARKRFSNSPARLFALEQGAEHKELKVRQGRQPATTHNVILLTIRLDERRLGNVGEIGDWEI
jgi:hypothetical protein